MPVEFLTAQHRASYGRYTQDPTSAQLARYFHLDDTDKAFIYKRRGNHNRLGFALQLSTVRFLGTFLSDPTDVPASVMSYVASQLSISDFQVLARYRTGESRWDHTSEIRAAYGYRDFNSQPEHWRLVRWLYSRAWLSDERPSILFDLATARLVKRKILLPGVTVLERLVASVRKRVQERLWRVLARLPSTACQRRLEDLLVCVAQGRVSALERLRQPPTRTSAPALVATLERLVEIHSLGVNQINLSFVPPNRLSALARYANTAWAQTLLRMPKTRRLATLLAFVHVLEFTVTDDALSLLELLVGELLSTTGRQAEKHRLRTIKDLDAAALQLCKACAVLLDPATEDVAVRATVFTQVSPTQLTTALNSVIAIARPPDDNYYDLMLSRWRHVRLFFPKLLQTIDFEATALGVEILQALQFLKSQHEQRKPDMSAAPLGTIGKSWAKLVFAKDGTCDRKAYTFCMLENLRAALRRRDLFVSRSWRWGDPRLKLLQGDAWAAARANVCRTLNLQPTPEEELKALTQQLDEAYRRTASSFPTNVAVRIEIEQGRPTLSP
ncbi:DUF4158 domain-containing protein [Chroococcidiopsis thermalis]|uniref:DUF4158 domain-containing protein n=1 Tax=Chroococcidiopsis thermalis TaxID=54299 RepID=UPI0003156992|nr:DUF4158 domain-containing protein [Chroococcidiopsis thermalis]PSB42793.1 Tn3 family transposase [Cyanosarcina cf. burmensis CCALA 770]